MTENSAKTVAKFTGILYEINNTIKSNSSILCFIIANTNILVVPSYKATPTNEKSLYGFGLEKFHSKM